MFKIFSRLSLIVTLLTFCLKLNAQNIGGIQWGLHYGVQKTDSRFINSDNFPELGQYYTLIDYQKDSDWSFGIFYQTFSPWHSEFNPIYNDTVELRVKGNNYGIRGTYWKQFNKFNTYYTATIGQNEVSLTEYIGSNKVFKASGKNPSASLSLGIAIPTSIFNLIGEYGYNWLYTGQLKDAADGKKYSALNFSGFYLKLGIVFKFGGKESSSTSIDTTSSTQVNQAQ